LRGRWGRGGEVVVGKAKGDWVEHARTARVDANGPEGSPKFEFPRESRQLTQSRRGRVATYRVHRVHRIRERSGGWKTKKLNSYEFSYSDEGRSHRRGSRFIETCRTSRDHGLHGLAGLVHDADRTLGRGLVLFRVVDPHELADGR